MNIHKHLNYVTMKINSLQTNYYPNFKAVKIAQTKNFIGNKAVEIDLYKLGREDRSFLKKWAEKIDFQELFPKLNCLDIERWERVFRYCITNAFESENTSYIAIHDNKPCGILTYLKAGNSFYLDGICSVPIEANKKVKNVGKTLFYQIFRDAKEANAREICLDAVKNGPFNVIEKYEKLKFKKDPTTHPYTKMVCNKHKIAEQLKEFPYEIEYKEIKPTRTNLLEYLD